MRLGAFTKLGKFGGGTDERNLSSESKPTIILVEPKFTSILQNGSSVNVNVTSNTAWSIPQSDDTNLIKWETGDGYIYLSQREGELDAVISISSDVNTGNRRIQDLEFVASNDSGETVSKIITMYQYGTDTLSFDGHYSDTPSSEYVSGIDGGGANSSFDRLIYCGDANG